jgi:hypothetical protein
MVYSSFAIIMPDLLCEPGIGGKLYFYLYRIAQIPTFIYMEMSWRWLYVREDSFTLLPAIALLADTNSSNNN